MDCHHGNNIRNQHRQWQIYRYGDKILSGLHLASKMGSIDEAEKLINNERYLHTVLSNYVAGCTPLHVAVTYNQTKIIKILLKNGSDFTLRDDFNETPLHIAFKVYSHQSIRLILQAYYTACSRINENIKRALFKRRFPIDAGIRVPYRFLKNFKPLHFAVTFDLVDIVPILIHNGIDVNSTDSNGMTALHCAVRYARQRIIRSLLSFKPDLLVKDPEGNTVLHMMAKAGDDFDKKCNLVVADRYLQIGGNVNELNNAGHTALHYACESGYKNLVVFLLNNGAEVNLTRSEDLKRPIHAALMCLSYEESRLSIDGQIALIQQLLQRGAYVDAEMTDGTTPILLATWPNLYPSSIPLTLCLLNWGCNVNCADFMDRTPLHNICLQSKSLRLIDQFLWHGADVNALDFEGKTPFSLALKWNNYDLFDNLDVYSWLKRLSILGAPLCQANRDIYASLENTYGNLIMKEVKDILQLRIFQENLTELPTDEQCRAELELMRTMRVDGDTTLYDILQMNTKGLYYSRNEYTNILADTSLDEDYPVYGCLVKAKLRITGRGVLLNRARQFMKTIFQADMPDVFSRIFSHMSHEDFVNFTEAFVPEKNKDDIGPTKDASDKSRRLAKCRPRSSTGRNWRS